MQLLTVIFGTERKIIMSTTNTVYTVLKSIKSMAPSALIDENRDDIERAKLKLDEALRQAQNELNSVRSAIAYVNCYH